MKFEVIALINFHVTVLWDVPVTQAAMDEQDAVILYRSTPLK
jgi:hypothetical protein